MTARGAAAATLEPASATRASGMVPPAPAPTMVVRLGDVELPVVRPAEAEEVVLDPRARLGQVELRTVRWPAEMAGPGPPDVRTRAAEPEAAAPAPTARHTTPQLIGAVDAPFVEGSVAIELDAGGVPTGSVRLEAAIGLPGARVAAFWYAATAWRPPSPFPVPAVEVDGDRLTISVPAGELAAVHLAGVGLEPIGEGRWTVPLPPALLAALGAAADGAEPAEPELVGVDRLAAARASLAEQPSERQPVADPARAVLEAILGVDLAALGVHVDPPAQRAAAAAGVPAFTLGSDAYFGAGAYGTDRQDLAQLLARAIAQALEGLSQVVLPDESIADPTQERSQVQPAAPAKPSTPPAPQPLDEAALDAEAATLAAEDAAEVATEQEVPAEVATEQEVPAEPAVEGVGEALAGTEAPAEGAEPMDGAPEEEAPAPIELIMPPAPAEPSPAQQERIAGASQGRREGRSPGHRPADRRAEQGRRPRRRCGTRGRDRGPCGGCRRRGPREAR